MITLKTWTVELAGPDVPPVYVIAADVKIDPTTPRIIYADGVGVILPWAAQSVTVDVKKPADELTSTGNVWGIGMTD